MIEIIQRRGGKPGTCTGCNRNFGNLANHEPFCHRLDHAAQERRQAGALIRAGAHTTDSPRPEQAWQHGVTDQAVALVLYGLEEMGVDIYLSRNAQWTGWTLGAGHLLHRVVQEMIRTGLLRCMFTPGPDPKPLLIPALVHLHGRDDRSICGFPGEGMGPMRSRLVTDLSLVDCIRCADSACSIPRL